jgi:polyisoprenoid-binding protein YceI
VKLRSIALAVLLAPVLAGAALAADTYEVDPVHSSVQFRIRHLDVSWVFGRFGDVSGEVVVDPEHPELCSVSMTVKAASVDTGNEKRDAHLRSADFLDVEKHPEIVFRSTSWKAVPVGSGGASPPPELVPDPDPVFLVTGDLTLHGVTRPVMVRVERTGSGTGRDGRPLVGFLATFNVNRSDFGMATMLGPVGDEVVLTVAVEAGRSETPPEENRLAPGMAPSPFSADEIRQGCPAGRITVFRVEQLAGPEGELETPRISQEEFRFLGGDEEKARIEIVSRNAEGEETGKKPLETTWKQLQGHAAWPEDRTRVSSETIETPAGTFVCWRYDVTIGSGRLARFWFAKDRPGPPVRMVRFEHDEVVFRMEMIRDDRP